MLLQALNSQFSSVKFVNLSVSCLGIFGRSADSFIDMCKELEIDKSYLRFIIRKTSNIIIQSTYFIFCRRNKLWNSPDLISFLLIVATCLFVCLFVCDFYFVFVACN